MGHARAFLRLLKWLIFLTVAVAAACAVVLATTDFNTYRPIIEKQVENALGRKVTITGDLKFAWRPTLSLTADGISVANADWSRRPKMLVAGRLNLGIALAPLLHGEISIRRMLLDDVDLLLEVDAKGHRNWDFRTTEPAGVFSAPFVGDLKITHAHIHYRDARDGEAGDFSIASLTAHRTDRSDLLRVDLSANAAGLPIVASGHLGRVEAWLRDEEPLSVLLDAKVAGAVGHITGTVARRADGRAELDFKTIVESKDGAATLRRVAAALPGVRVAGLPVAGPLHLSARAHGPVDGFGLSNIKMTAGGPGGGRLSVTGNIGDAVNGTGIALKAAAEGDDLTALLRGFDLAAPATLGPFRATAHVGGTWKSLSMSGIDATAGSDSVLAANLRGRIDDLVRLRGLDLQAYVTGPDLPAALERIGPWLPADPPWTASLPGGTFKATARVTGPAAAPVLSDVDVRLSDPALGWRLSAKGRVDNPMAGRGIDLALTTDVENSAAVARILGWTWLPPSPVRVSLRLSERAGGYAFDRLSARAGATVVTGRGDLLLDGPRPNLKADLSATVLDWDELLPPDQTGPPSKDRDDSSSPQMVIPSDPLPFSALRDFDADITVNADRMIVRDWGFSDVAAHLRVDGGILKVDPLSLRLAGGLVKGAVSVDARPDVPKVAIDLDGRGLGLGPLLSEARATEAANAVDVRVGIDTSLTGSGRSLSAIAADLTGSVRMVGRDGRINSDTLNFSSRGLSDLLPWMANTDSNRLNCVAARFDVDRGLARSRLLLLDTNGLTYRGRGSVNLGNERLDFLLVPTAKKMSLAKLATPIAVGGTLADPTYSTDVTESAIRAVTGTVQTMGEIVVTPLELLGGLVGLGRKKQADDPCLAVLSTAPAAKRPSALDAAPASPRK